MTFCNRLVIRVCEINAETADADEGISPILNRIMEIPHAIGSIMIGSDPVVNLRLDSPEVSGVHARICREDDQFCIEDLASRNGTELNGRRIIPGKPAMIVPGDQIRIGHFRLDIDVRATSEVRHETILADRNDEISRDVDAIIERFELPAQYPKLVVSTPVSVDAQMLILEDTDRHYSIGRHVSCDYVIDSLAVSRRHASVFRTEDDHVFILDCGSSNGIRVNGKWIKGKQALQDGDRIEIGPVVWHLELPRLGSLKFESHGENNELNVRVQSEIPSSPDRVSDFKSRLIRWLVRVSAVTGMGSLILAIWFLYHLL